MSNIENNVLELVVRAVYSDDYTTEQAQFLRDIVTSYALNFKENGTFKTSVLDSIFNKIFKHELVARLTAEGLTDYFLKQLTLEELKDLLCEIESKGTATEDQEEKNRLREQYKKVKGYLNASE